MPKDSSGEEICTFLVEGYGVCSKRADHIVHQMMGISPVEHPFHKELNGKIEEMRLSKRNVRKIARRSGKSIEDLELMRQFARNQGRVLTLRYEVKEDDPGD